MIEKIAVAEFAFPQLPVAMAEEQGRIANRPVDGGNFVRALRQTFERRPVRQAARVLLQDANPSDQAPCSEQIKQQGPERSEETTSRDDQRQLRALRLPI